MDFNTAKRKVLADLQSALPDRSRKGGVDEAIIPVLNAVNAHPNYYTTSSCAGRFLVIGLTPTAKKHTSKWLYVSHDTIEVSDIIRSISFADDISEIWFRCESPILHVCCRDTTSASLLLDAIRPLGMKRSGVISMRQDKIIIEIIATVTLALPLAKNSEALSILDDAKYLQALVEEAKTMLARSRNQFDGIISCLSALHVSQQIDE